MAKMTEQNWEKWKDVEEEDGNGVIKAEGETRRGGINANVPEWEWKVGGDKGW